MDKKTLPIIILLVLAIIFYFPILEFLGVYTPAERPDGPADTTTAVETTIAAPDTPLSETIGLDTTVPPSGGLGDLAESAQLDAATPSTLGQAVDTLSRPADTIVVETERSIIALTTAGGGPVSIQLKEYAYRDGMLDGQPIELLPRTDEPVPDARFAGGSASSNAETYVTNTRPGRYQVTANDSMTVDFTYDGPNGGRLTKSYTFYGDRYDYRFVLDVDQRERLGIERRYDLVWNNPLDITEPDRQPDYDAFEVIAFQANERVNLKDWNEGRLEQERTGTTSWLGVRSRYFAGVLVPLNRLGDGAFANGDQFQRTVDGEGLRVKRMTGGLEIPIELASSFSDSFLIYAGPLDYEELSSYERGLEDILGIGTTPFVGWIIKPFAVAINWLLPRMYSVIPNYGLVIILFAFLVKLVTLPLSMRAFKSMQGMKDLAPKMEELKKKYEKDPQRMSQETMKMYKEMGVNPLSGCWPMIAQMPLFFALFSVFRSTILLRDAPFVWPITDLSHGATGFTDPYIILVVIMVGAQFISQRLTTPQTAQNKMLLYLMPLLFGFLFYRFAAGLVLYWTTFSILSLLDWFLFRRKHMQEVAVAADGEVKPAKPKANPPARKKKKK